MLLRKDGSFGDFAPQVLAERTPQITNSYFYGDQGIQMLGHWEEYAALYRTQPVVATLVDKLANSGARLPVKVWQSGPSGRTEDTDSDFAKLLKSPSRTLSPFNFYRWTFSTYEVMGEAYWLKVRDNTGKPVALEPMHPNRVAIKREPNGQVNYIFSIGVANAGILTVPATDVVAFQRYNPDNTMRGLSRLEQLRVTLLNEDAARRASAAFWKNGARPSVVLTHPDSLSQQAIDRIKSQFDSRHASADNFGGSVVLEEGMTVQVTQLNAEEMEYIESRKLNMQEACMVYDVPPPVVHILDHATFSNITEQMRSMYRDTMAPRLEDFESVIDFSLRTEFYPNGGREAEFDMTEVLRGDFETRSTTAAALRQGGILSGNEAREVIGLDKSDDPLMDKVFANTALQALGQTPAAGGAAGDPAAPGGPDDHRVPGDELLDGGPKPGAKPAPGTVPGDELLAKPKPGAPKPKPVIGGKAPHLVAIERAVAGAAGRAVKAGTSVQTLQEQLVERHLKALEPYFAEQKAAAKRGDFGPKAPARKGLLRADLKDADPTDPLFDELDDNDDGVDTYGWDDDLAAILGTLSASAAAAIGKLVFAKLGGDQDAYDPTAVQDMLKVESGHAARRINAATYQQIADRLAAALADSDSISDADLDSCYEDTFTGLTGEAPYRLQTMAKARVQQTTVTAGEDAADQAGATQKQWQVNSPHPRAEHEALDGELAELGQAFSNGMMGPGDIAGGGIDQVAGCNCSVNYVKSDAKSLGRKYSPDQERDDHGRFGSGGGADPSSAASDMREPDGGFTWSPSSGMYSGGGFAVSTNPERGVVIPNVAKLSTDAIAAHIQEYAKANSDLLSQPGHYLGGWHDPQTGEGDLDISRVVQTEDEARQLALTHNQIAYFNMSTFESVDVSRDNTGSRKGLGLKYSPDQPRDDHGRFGEGDGGGDAPLGASIKPSAGDLANMAKSRITGPHMLPDGSGFTAERQALHQQIIAEHLRGVEPPADGKPTLYMNGGGPGSGKSSLRVEPNASITGYPDTREIATDGTSVGTDHPGAVLVDPDGVKFALTGGPDGQQDWAAATHEESSYLAKAITQAAVDKGLNIVYDGTGNSGADSVGRKLAAAQDAGYRTEANYLYTDPQVGMDRAITRGAATGRYVPPSVIAHTYADIPDTFSKVATNGTFDKINLFDNNSGNGARLIASGDGKTLNVSDPEAYGKFLSTAHKG